MAHEASHVLIEREALDHLRHLLALYRRFVAAVDAAEYAHTYDPAYSRPESRQAAKDCADARVAILRAEDETKEGR